MVFLTGGTGFIGSYILYTLLVKYPTVRALRRPSSTLQQTEFIFKHLAEWKPLPGNEDYRDALKRVELVEGEMADYDSLYDALQGQEVVYHAAANVSFSKKDKAHTLRTNAEGTANLVNACLDRGVRQLGYVSSVAALGRKTGQIADEETHMEDNRFSNAYSESKYRAEMEVWRGIAEGLPAVIINPGIVLGWGNFETGSPALFRTVKNGLKYYPDGGNAFVDACDVAECLVRLMETPEALNQRFICISENLRFKELFDLIAEAFGVRKPHIHAGRQASLAVALVAEFTSFFTRQEPFVTREMAISSSNLYTYNNSKLREILGYTFIPIAQTVKDVVRVFP